jgi:hypothetical protein
LVRSVNDLIVLNYEEIYQSEPQCMDQRGNTSDTSCTNADYHFIIYSINLLRIYEPEIISTN